MYSFQRFCFKFRLHQHFFSTSSSKYNSNHITKVVDPHSTVSIHSNFNISIQPYDLLDCPDANTIRATLLTPASSKQPECDLDILKRIQVSVHKNNINIADVSAKETIENLTVRLEVPIKSDLNVETKNSISIKDMYSDSIKAITHTGSIVTKNLRSTSIILSTINGNIDCRGITLGQKIDVDVKEKGNVFFEKLQGNSLYCKTFEGNINVDSSYIDKSSFCSESGDMLLKNIHKSTEVLILKQGNIEMSGINGNVYINSKEGNLDLQFSEIKGDNIIVANKSKNVNIYISDHVESKSYIDLHSDKIELDSSAKHLLRYLADNKHFEYGNKDKGNKLMVCSAGLLRLGKKSWIDIIKAQKGLS